MPIELTELTPGFAARVSGIDLREPVSAADSATVRDAIDRYGVLVLPRPVHHRRAADGFHAKLR